MRFHDAPRLSIEHELDDLEMQKPVRTHISDFKVKLISKHLLAIFDIASTLVW